MKNNKGITLISLISSLILIFILGATTVVTSMNAFNTMKFEGAKAELEEVQKIVDEISSDYKTYLAEGNASSYAQYFSSRYNANDFNTKYLYLKSSNVSNLKSKYSEINNAITSSVESYFYFTADDLMKYFGLKGIDDVVVDFATRKVYSVNGIKDPDDKTKIYYTAKDWGKETIEENFTPEQFKIKVEGTKPNISLYFVKVGAESTKVRVNFKIKKVLVSSDSGNTYKEVDFRNATGNEATSVTTIKISVDNTVNKYRVVDYLGNIYDS